MIKRLGIWLLALVFMAPAVALAQTGQQVAFPNLGYDVGQWKYIIDGFYQGFFIFKMIAGRCDGESCSQALFYLALTAGLVGGLMFLLNPKFQQIPIIVSWVALVFILIIGPYNTQGRTQNLLFYTFGADEDSRSFAGTDTDACVEEGTGCGVTAFMPQLMVIHAISTIHQGLFQALYRCNEYGCEIRDPISEILVNTAFQGMRDVFSATANHEYLAYEAGLLRQQCNLGTAEINKVPYDGLGYQNLVDLMGAERANEIMIPPSKDATMRQDGFTMTEVANAIRVTRYSGSDTSVWPPIALLMSQADYKDMREASLIGDTSASISGGAANDSALNAEIRRSAAATTAQELIARNEAIHNLADTFNLQNLFTSTADEREQDPYLFLDKDDELEELYTKIIVRSYDIGGRNMDLRMAELGHPSFLVGSIGPNEYDSTSWTLRVWNNEARDFANNTIYNRARRGDALAEFNGDFGNGTEARFLAEASPVSQMPVFLGLYRKALPRTAVDTAVNDGSALPNFTESPILGGYGGANNPIDFSDNVERAKAPSPHWVTGVDTSGNFNYGNSDIYQNKIVRNCADLHASYNSRRAKILLAAAGYGAGNITQWMNARPAIYDPGSFNIGDFSDREKVADTYELAFQRIYQNAPESGRFNSAAHLAGAARVFMLNKIFSANYLADSANIVYASANYGADPNVQAAVDDAQLGIVGGLIGELGTAAAENLIGLVANIVGVAATIYLNFIIKLIDLSMMAILMFTPLFFLMGLLVPSHAPGLLILSVAIVLVLKMVPITIMLVNLCLSMIFSVLGVNPDNFLTNLEAGILLFAAGGLYTGVVGLTLFILFKIGDTGNLQMIGRLDDGAKRIAESFEKVAYTLTALGVSGATGGMAGMVGAANKAGKDGKGLLGTTADGFKGLAVGAFSQSSDVITKGLAQIPGVGGVGAELGNAWGQGQAQGKAVSSRGLKGYVGDHFQAGQAQHDAKEDQTAYAAERARAGGDPVKQALAAMNNPDLNNYERLKAVESLMKMLGQSSGTVAFPVATENNPNAQFDNLLDALASTSKARQVGNGDIQKGTDQITSVMEEVVTKANGKMVNAAPEIIDNGDGTHTVAAKMTGEFKNQLDNDPALKAKFTGLLEAAGIDYDWEEGRIYTNGRDGVRLASTAARENAALQGGHSTPAGPAPGGGGGGQGGGDNSGGGDKGTTQAVQRSADSIDQSVKGMTDAMKNAINNLARDLVAASKEASDGMTRAATDMQKAAKDISEAAQKLDKKE